MTAPPFPQPSPQPRLRQLLRRLWRQFSRRRRLQLLALAALLLVSSLAEMLSLGAVVPFLAVLAEPQRVWGTGKAQWLAGVFGWQSAGELVLPLCLAFGAAALLAGAVRLLTLWASVRLANAIGSDLSIAVYRRTLYQPYAVHLQRNSSDTISAIANQVGAVVTMLNSLLQLATAGLVSVGLVAVLLWLNPGITLAMAAVVGGGYGLAMGLSRQRLRRIGPAIVADQARVIRSLQEGLGAIRDVILDGSQPMYTRLYGEADRRLRRHQGQGQVLSLAPRYGMEAVGLAAIAIAALVLVAGRAGFLGGLPLLGALALGAQRLLPTLQLIYGSWAGFRQNQPALASVLGYLEQPIAPEDLEPAPPPLPLERELRLEGVSFRYGPELPWVLRDGDLSIRRGERIGIVGETGSGKSTLVDLLMGLLQPTAGRILVDGQALEGERLRRWRATIAHVPQSIFLADGSIAENIAFGVEPSAINWPRLEWAAQQAQIASFIETLDRGYHSAVGERGVRLSGGQRQRIGIARALYREAQLLVLDEATSALDNATEAEVMQAIEGLGSGITVLMIAHRLSTLGACERVVALETGSIHMCDSLAQAPIRRP
ncbi:ABC transporter ATP-binding protein [Vulcanococcus limneticus]|uniref:ABC transporter ATP-binding protein n=1 Tax=Vulcanococcus limneticus TaxID=2170428 RepID=UPI00398BE0CF